MGSKPVWKDLDFRAVSRARTSIDKRRSIIDDGPMAWELCHLGSEALHVVVPEPDHSVGGVGDLLLRDPVDGGSVDEGAGLGTRANTCPTHSL